MKFSARQKSVPEAYKFVQIINTELKKRQNNTSLSLLISYLKQIFFTYLQASSIPISICLYMNFFPRAITALLLCVIASTVFCTSESEKEKRVCLTKYIYNKLQTHTSSTYKFLSDKTKSSIQKKKLNIFLYENKFQSLFSILI